jgi:enoyl-CoA hydratase/carnithine racemase
VGYEVRERIAYISFNRPEKHNALRDEEIQALVSALDRLDGDSAADIGILFGHGRSFSSGGDVSERLQRSMDEGSTSGRVTEGDAFLHCANFKPVIAAVHGYCLGHALSTAFSCDLIVAARNTRFQVTEIRIGLPMTSLLPRLGPSALANEACLTGRMFGAEEAWEAGMLTRLVDDGKHVEAAEDLARLILENPQAAVREHVRVCRILTAEAGTRTQELSVEFRRSWTTNSEARAAVAALGAQKSPRQ